ncbi:MAG TPA: hypothetical protein VNM22_20500 [Candidatus Limnocylindrales bacterium]|nr:hypothetical protein [Candidatus Limnocylindrales bacterium]
MSYYIHNIPGRLRIKTPVAKSSSQQAKAIQRILHSIPGILSTLVNPLTGSIVIHYDPEVVNSEEILNTLNQQDYFDWSRAVTNDQYIRDIVAKIGKVIWKAFFGTLVEEALEGSSLSFIKVLI